MMDTSRPEIKLFYCYARKDKPFRDELEIHLSWLKRRYQLTTWHDREILPGEEWEQIIDTHLNTSNLVLLLISPDFMASDYCYGKEMQRALDRHKAGTCRVVPILSRPTFWEEAPFSSLQLLPTNARPITSWPNADEAFQDVVAEVNRAIKDLLNSFQAIEIPPQKAIESSHTIKNPSISSKTKEDWVKEGNALFDFKRYKEAIAACDQAIRLDPIDAIAYINKGAALNDLERYGEAHQLGDGQ
jgi:tetratricopeptide (TPR) repeat protein